MPRLVIINGGTYTDANSYSITVRKGDIIETTAAMQTALGSNARPVSGVLVTALTSSVSPGTTSLPVTTGTGSNFSAGQLIVVDSGEQAETCRIFGVAANTITVLPGVVKAHPSGAAVTGVYVSPTKPKFPPVLT
jgi:hypothetical protein